MRSPHSEQKRDRQNELMLELLKKVSKGRRKGVEQKERKKKGISARRVRYSNMQGMGA